MTTELVIFFCVLVLFVGTGLSILYATIKTGSSPMPSTPAIRRAILEAILAEKASTGRCLELGSGWGGLARTIAETFPQRTVTGVELSPLPWFVSKIFQVVFGPTNLAFLNTDITAVDCRDVDLVVCYLSGETLKRIAPVLEQVLPPDCVIVSAMFSWPGRVPVQTVVAQDMHHSPVYVYRLQKPPI